MCDAFSYAYTLWYIGPTRWVMHKDFDTWNGEKKRVNARVLRDDFFYHPREVWWTAIGLNVDVETDGKQASFERPVLVIRKFNKEMFWGVPMTSRPYNGPYHHKVTHEEGESWAMLSQLKIFSTKRLRRRVGMISETDFKDIRTKLSKLITS